MATSEFRQVTRLKETFLVIHTLIRVNKQVSGNYKLSGFVKHLFYFLCIKCFVYVCARVHHMCAWRQQRPEEGSRASETGVYR